MLFEKTTTITKRNHIFFGPTESHKMATTLDETSVDLHNIYGHFNSQRDEFAAIASGYVDVSGRLSVTSGLVKELEDNLDSFIYINATQDPIF